MPTLKKLNYSEALKKLIKDGGRITREFWTTEEWRAGCDRLEGNVPYVRVITARELDLPEGTRLNHALYAGALVYKTVRIFEPVAGRRPCAVVEKWSPGEGDLLAVDWQWMPRREER